MRVVHSNKFEKKGGAAVAANRLHRGLGSLDVDSVMLVESKSSGDETVKTRTKISGKTTAKVRRVLDKAYLRLRGGASDEFSTGLIPSKSVDRIDQLSPDIVHLHWVADGYQSIRDISNIEHSVIWTLHDMWPITGGCHYSGSCSRYTTSCGDCPVLRRSSSHDLSSEILEKKKRLWNPDWTIVAPSNWMARRARESSVFHSNDVPVIPNGLDTNQYRPIVDSTPADFDLPDDRNIVLFGGAAATGNPRKGYDLLREAVDGLADQSEYMLVLFGDNRPDIGHIDIETRPMGYLDRDSLIRLYSVADVMAVPSRYESFGQTATEALSCGTPVVAFDGTGVADIVTHKKTGYLASPYSPADLGEGIRWLTESPARLEDVSENARKRAVNKYDINEVCEQHMKLYKKVAR